MSAAQLPPGDPAELARRLGIPADTFTTPQLDACLSATAQMLAGRVDPTKVMMNEAAWLEGLYSVAVRLWDAGTKGVAAMDMVGGFAIPGPAATSGLWRSAAGVLQPVLKSGGIVVA